MKFGILTVSDRSAAGEREDLSGPALVKAVEQAGWTVSRTAIVPDELREIADILIAWSDEGECSVILTSGGTGFSPRDITPEATAGVIDRDAPGLAEAMRAGSLKITPHAMLSRAAAGIRGSTLIINLPGSPKGALENFRVIAPVLVHAVQLLEGIPGAESGHSPGRAI
ncbi:MAG: molybdenum cofactor biosynthesis protein B [Anaerolineales bacterium]